MTLHIRQETLHWHHHSKPYKICHLSDLHLKWAHSRHRLTHIETHLHREKPHLIAMTGDYSDTPHGAKLAHQFITHLSKTYPVCWITGNHDHWYGPDLLQPLHHHPNCHAIDHAPHHILTPQGHQYQITSWQHHLHNPTPPHTHRIILIHNPENIAPTHLNSPQQHLILAGHLHAGQFIFWTSKNTHHFPGSLLYRHCCARQTIGTNHSTLIVSAGLGDTLPLRFRCPHEIVSITIH